MRRFTPGLLALGILSCAQFSAASDSDNIRVIVKYKQRPSLVNSLLSVAKLPVKSVQPMAGGAYSITFDNQAFSSVMKESADPTSVIISKLKQNPDVIYAVKDRKGYFKPLPKGSDELNPPRLTHEAQWDEFSRPGGIMLESAPDRHDGAWAYTTGQSISPIVIAVLDTGIADHDSLTDNLVKDEKGNIWGWNFAGNNYNLNDETQSFHGTHVAGTIAGYGATMRGIGENLKILPLKIPGESGMFYESAVVNAIRWSVGDHIPGVPDNPYPAKVLNISFGVDERPVKEIDHCDEALQDALFFAREKGAVVVTAAGNDNLWDHYSAPAVCNGAIKVASTGPQGLRAYYSNFGPSIAYAAPGGDLSSGHREDGILSTVHPNGGYQGSGFDFYQGTSMAAPHVTGVAGLIFAVTNGGLSPQEVEQLLYTTTHEFGKSDHAENSCRGKMPCGHGILDAENAVKAALAHFDIMFTAPGPDEEKRLMQSSVSKNNLRWIPLNTMKPLASLTSLTHVQQDDEGKIYAFSGDKTYQLNDKKYKQCQVIGFDGIGCYY